MSIPIVTKEKSPFEYHCYNNDITKGNENQYKKPELKNIDKEAEQILSEARAKALKNEDQIVAKAKEEAAAAKQKEKEEAFLKKQKEKEAAAKQKKKEKAAEKIFNKTIGRATSSAFGSIGRHIGNSIIRGLFGNSK